MTIKRLISIVVCGLLVSCTGSSSDAQDQGQIGPKGWVSDVSFLLAQMEEIHPDLYHRHTREEWQAEASRLGQTLSTGSETDAMLGFCRLVALADDGQTRVIPPSDAAMNLRWLPLVPHRYSDGWYVRAAQDAYVPVIGMRLLEIGGMPVDEVAEKIRPLTGADNGIGALEPMTRLMRNVAALEFLGVPQLMPDSMPVAYADANGARRTRWVSYTQDTAVTIGWRDAAASALMRRSLYQTLEGNYAYQYIPQDRLLYVKFETAQDSDSLNIADFFARVFAFADSADVQRLALDIRNNHGGDRYLNEPVLHGLIKSADLNVPGKVFVIIGRGTYAAGMALAVALESNTPALFVGEPTGGRPNQYGDPKAIVLPQSGITVECSSLYWQNSDPRDMRPWITPDITALQMWGDFFHGVDPAFQVVRMIDYNHLKRLFPSDGPGPSTEDRVYGTRWQRANQLQFEDWPALLGP